MLAGFDDPERVVGKVAPLNGESSIEKIAINAVMAGCLPEYMPTLVAAVTAICQEPFNLAAVQGTNDPVAAGIIVNGPIRFELDLNSGVNALGPGRRANATIGRALRLILINLGGGVPGVGDLSNMGRSAQFTFCCGENEEHSPWPPYHEERGYERAKSTATVIAPIQTMLIHVTYKGAHPILDGIVEAVSHPGGTVVYCADAITILIPPAEAHVLARAGLSRDDIARHIYEHARVPLDRLEYLDEKVWDLGERVQAEHGRALPVKRPEDIHIFVVGSNHDHGSIHYLGGWMSRPVTEIIS